MEESSSLGNDECMQNSIDRLPDELLVSIVSLLSVKEAGRTSVLARRWRYFWKCNPILDFDGSEMVHKLENGSDSLESKRIRFGCWVNRVLNLHSRETIDESERIRFVGWVNRVLNLHSRETIDEFRVSFNLDNGNANDIDRWIEFSFAKRVKKLELNMLVGPDPFDYGQYALRILPLGGSTCESLVSLRLAGVHVTGEVLELFISNCPFLEELSVKYANGFASLRTSCQAIRLRRLEINRCPYFRRLEICSPNLVLCTLFGFYITIVLKDVSSLINLSLGVIMPGELSNILLDNSGCLSRLETLTLQTTTLRVDEELEFPNLPRLKKLEFDIDTYHGGSRLCFITPLIDAAPLLSEIVLKLKWSPSLMQRQVGQLKWSPSLMQRQVGQLKWSPSLMQRQARQRPDKGQKHQCLKVFEIVGFASAVIGAVEVALYVLENAASLEKMIINGMAVTGKGLDQLKAKLSSETCDQDITGSVILL